MSGLNFGKAKGTIRRPMTALTTITAMALALSGCATDALRVGRASEMVTAGRAAIDGSRAVVASTFESHQRLVIELASLDPYCDVTAPRLALGKNKFGCTVDPKSKGDTLSGPSRTYARLTLAQLDGAIAYLDAIDAIATRKPIDIAGTLETAHGELSSAIDAANALTGAKLVLPISADQLGAAKTLLDLLSEVISAARQTRDFKKIESKLDAGEFKTSVAQVREMTARWSEAIGLAIDNEIREVEGVRNLQQRAFDAATAKICKKGSPPDCPYSAVSPANRAEYRATATLKFALVDRRAHVTELQGKLDTMLTTFVETREAYRQLLFDAAHTKLTAKERKLKASIIRRQILSAIKGVLAIVALF